jgi:uncharacterized membrane protein (DUF373 family)
LTSRQSLFHTASIDCGIPVENLMEGILLSYFTQGIMNTDIARPAVTLIRAWGTFDALIFFNRVMDLFFKLLIFFVILVLAMGMVRLFWEVWRIMAASELKEAFTFTVTNLLTFFIIMELFKSLVEYFREHRLKLTFIVDATLVFLLREIMISLYQHQSPPLQIAALALLALVLGAVRTLAIIYSPIERKMVEHLGVIEGQSSPDGQDVSPPQPLQTAH